MASKRVLWATTTYGPHEIKIYTNSRFRGTATDGQTSQSKKGVSVDISPDAFHDAARLDEVLLHELVHALEYLNSPDAFSIETLNNCTRLAQTVGQGLAQMLRTLRRAPKPPRRASKPRKT